MGVIKETALGVEVALPVDATDLLRTPPTFSYFMTPAEYFDDEDPGPLIEVQMETQEKTGTVRLSLTHMLGKDCKLFAGPATKIQIGSSVNFEANETIQPNITLEEVGEEDRIDENTFQAIERKWFSTNVNLNMPHTRYTVHCPITAVPDYESVVSRRISFVGARANLIKWKQSLPKGNYSSPGPDDTLAMVRFILDDAQDPSYEGSIAATPNSGPAHRYRLSFTNGSASVRWIDTAASRRHDLLLILAGAVVAFAATILFELTKFALPMRR